MKRLSLVCLVLYAWAVYGYLTLRFDGSWGESDTSIMTRIIYYSDLSNSVIDSPLSYTNGFTYTALSMLILKLTGIPLQTLQQVVYLVLAGAIPLFAFAAYRALTRSSAIAFLAVFLLYVQPDFLWVTWRGSHEKVTWTLVLVLLLISARSFNVREQPGMLARYVLLFYGVALGLICTNAFFALSFVNMLTLSFLGGTLLFMFAERRTTVEPDLRRHVQRLGYAALSCSLLVYIVTFHLYPPLSNSLSILNTLVERLSAIFLNIEVAANPYTSATNIWWINSQVYLAVTALNWLILLISFVTWANRLWRLARHRQMDFPLLLWIIYPTFMAQLVVSTIVDLAGVLGGNFQVRIFTPVMLTAIPIAAIGVHGFLSRGTQARRLALALAGSACAMLFAAASLLKASNEPLLNNRWLLLDPTERAAGSWLIDHANYTVVWTGMDERVREGMYLYYPQVRQEDIWWDAYTPDANTRYYLFSQVEQIRWLRMGRALPYFDPHNLIYDNGTTQIYHRRPQTPYER
jgi:hypothetical protein